MISQRDASTNLSNVKTWVRFFALIVTTKLPVKPVKARFSSIDFKSSLMTNGLLSEIPLGRAQLSFPLALYPLKNTQL